MERIETIELQAVLPAVFEGSEGEPPVSESGVWMREVTFRRGDVSIIEAESGTGKSSLCSYIYGNRRDYRGKILFNGRDTGGFTTKEWCELRRRHLALLPQEMRLFPELTVMENIELKNRLTGYKSEAEIRAMLDRLEIGAKAFSRAAHLSIGQQQRVAIVRALCQPFDFLLLDEPVSHLDLRNNDLAASLIAGEASSQGAAIIATSVGNPLNLDFNRHYSL